MIASYEGLHAPYLYDLVVCNAIEGKWIGAVTAARGAIAAGPYIAELLLGQRKPLTMPMGSLGGYRSLGEAELYTRRFWWQWRRDKTPRALLRWVATHPLVLAELGQLRGQDYAAADAAEPETRAVLIDACATAIRNLEDTLSIKMLRRASYATDRDPWSDIAAEMPDNPYEWSPSAARRHPTSASG